MRIGKRDRDGIGLWRSEARELRIRIARTRASATEIEIRGLASYLEDLEARGVLDAYVARRRAEVTSESRALFLKEAS